ncbi:MAG: Smr/MutS family protein [Alphaproteobacteria bacterium]|nr:Smr/MutS family protein [Alphaproteobacteria bacterium]
MSKHKPKAKAKAKKARPEDGMALWRTVAATVEPLAGRDQWHVEFQPTSMQTKPDASAPARPRPRGFVNHLRDTTAPPPVLPELTHDAQPGLDKATAKRMKRGQVSIAARLDLHGLTQSEAHRALDAFIEASWRAGRREVLVITGKGTRTDGAIGVLRREVPRWLNEQPNRSRVVAFSHAAPKDGGEGALYIRLKKSN